MTSAPSSRLATGDDLSAISALHARVFGPGRYARSAYRVREGKGLRSRFCRVVEIAGTVVAAIRLTEVTVGGHAGAILLGPIAVDSAYGGRGLGSQLIADALGDLRRAGVAVVLLVGDEPFYARFGFHALAPATVVMPGPVNPARLLALELRTGALGDYVGVVSAIPPSAADRRPAASADVAA